MSGGPATVRCPHCGAENPRSLLVTMCQECRGDLSAGEVDPPVPARPARARPRAPIRPPEPQVPAPKAAEPAPRPQLPPVPARPPRPHPEERVPRPPTYELRPVPPPERRHSSTYGRKAESQATGILIVLFALVMFGIGFALLLWLTD
jgi:hypothetical protein